MSKKSIFIIRMVDIRKRTEEKIKQEYRKKNAKISFEEFSEFYKSEDGYCYSTSTENVGYFINYKLAEKSVLLNELDIADSLYDYAIIIEFPANCIYPQMHMLSLHVFKYNHEKNKTFEEVFDGYNDETVFIFKKQGLTIA